MTRGVTGPDIRQLENANAAMLRRAWVKAKGSAPPRTFTARLMRLALAFDAQLASGGSEAANVRRAWSRVIRDRSVRRDAGNGRNAGASKICEGTRILKEWGGTTHEVLVRADGGAVWNGQSYSSLSAVARAMTGTNRNGPKFFGLRGGGTP